MLLRMKPIQKRPEKKPPKKSRRPLIIFIVIFVLIIGWILPIPKLKAKTTYAYRSNPQLVSLAWPAYGQSAVGAVGYGVLDTHGLQTAAPMASLTKTVTAMAVLQKKPLKPGEQGPTITITPEDIVYYNNAYAQGGSVVAVTSGEQLSEYQALQAMLLPSANNMADTLARWAFGLNATTLSDASGLSDKSVSTAQDLTTLGVQLVKNPVLKEVIAQPTAEIPVAGTVHNTNWLLGQDGIFGIKTGNTDQAGGCYLFASHRLISGHPVDVVGTVMGAPDLNTAISDSRTLLASVDTGFSLVTPIRHNQVVGVYSSAWGDVVNILAQKDLSVLNWRSRQVVTSITMDTSHNSVKAGQPLGQMTATAWGISVTSPLVAQESIKSPSWHWRLYQRYIGG
jgi:D-alanyl-D-alanine carboxypeptidase (penicillin-binding protein 5/6)